MTVTHGRVYGGLNAEERAAQRRAQFLEAALELLGSGAPFTVTGVIEAAGLAPRYFYDIFTSLDELQLAVFDDVAAEAERRSLAALTAVDRRPRARTRAVLREMVDFLLDDPRRGRLLLIASLGSPVLAPRRVAELHRFTRLLAVHGNPLSREVDADSEVARTAASYAMGGFAEVMSAAVADPTACNRDTLVDHLAELFQATGRAFARMTPRARDTRS